MSPTCTHVHVHVHICIHVHVVICKANELAAPDGVLYMFEPTTHTLCSRRVALPTELYRCMY